MSLFNSGLQNPQDHGTAGPRKKIKKIIFTQKRFKYRCRLHQRASKCPLAWTPLIGTSRYVLVMCASCTYDRKFCPLLLMVPDRLNIFCRPGSIARYNWPHSFSCVARCCNAKYHVITNATYNRDPVPAKFKHVTNIETYTLLCCDYSTLWEALHANKVEIVARCSDKNVKILGRYQWIGW